MRFFDRITALGSMKQELPACRILYNCTSSVLMQIGSSLFVCVCVFFFFFFFLGANERTSLQKNGTSPHRVLASLRHVESGRGSAVPEAIVIVESASEIWRLFLDDDAVQCVSATPK